ncbi:hypothetical protein Q7P35_012209 [Cladosporium inversicolor]
MATAAQDEFNELMRDKERRTTHPEDANSDARSFLNLSDDDDNDRTPPASNYDPDENLPRARAQAPPATSSRAPAMRNHRTSLRSLVGAQQPVVEEPPQRHWTQEPSALEKLEEGDDGLDDEEMDEGFISRWRQGRLKELQNGAYESGIHKSGKSRRSYGGLTTVDGEGYLNAVEKSGPSTVVIVYIYDDMSHVSQMIEDCVRTLARKHSNVRFVRLHYQDAEMEPAGVPALLAYRGGDKFAGLVPIMEEMPDDAELSSLTLEAVMMRHQIL